MQALVGRDSAGETERESIGPKRVRDRSNVVDLLAALKPVLLALCPHVIDERGTRVLSCGPELLVRDRQYGLPRGGIRRQPRPVLAEVAFVEAAQRCRGEGR